MVAVTCDVRPTAVLSGLRKAQTRMRFAAVNALNATGKAVQAAEKVRLRRVMQLRKPGFMEQQVAVIRKAEGGSGFASVRDERFEVRLQVGQKPRLLLAGFEQGAARPPFKGKSVAIPLVGGARPSKAASVPESLWVQRLALRRRSSGSKKRPGHSGSAPIVGLLGTYIVPKVGILQHIAGQARGRLLYLFKRSMRLRPILGWMRTAIETAQRDFPAFLQREIADAIRHSMGG